MEGLLDLAAIIMVVFSLSIVVAVLPIWNHRRSGQQTLFTTLLHYSVATLITLISWIIRRQFEKETKNCTRIQEQTLMKILKENADTVYGREYKLGEMKNKEEFVANHPLTFYEHYQPYIDRVANGETKILTSQPPRELASTSGTTGNSKLLIIEKNRQVSVTKRYLMAVYEVGAVYSQGKSPRKTALFFQPYIPKFRKSKGGLAITNGMSDISKTPFFTVIYTSPRVTFEIATEREALYVHLLFALKDRELGSIVTGFAMHLYHTLVALETDWESLVNDIGRGRVKEDLSISELIKSDLDKRLYPDPQRADELKLEFLKGFDNTIVRRIWPHITYAMAITSGSSAFYAEKVREKYLDIPIFSYFYGSTEGLIGQNIWPEKQYPDYALIPSEQFFEFIPIENMEEDQPETFFAEEVEVGSVYEIVVTNPAGLYRFRMGDVVKIVRFYNNAPVLQYQYRNGQLLNVHAEKTSEKMMSEALEATLNDNYPSSELMDYTCAESAMLEGHKVGKDIKDGGETALGKVAPCYIIFLEFEEGQDVIRNDLNTFAKQLDDNICDRNPMYESFRQRGGISIIQVYILKSGTFDKLIQLYHNRNPLVACRFKLPRLTKLKEGLELLLSNVI